MANLSSKTGTVTTPVQAQISLANNSTTSVQDMSAYDSQEVTGFVYVDATADLRCSFSVQVVKNGAGTYEIAASDQSGDNYSGAPLLAFSMSGSVLRVTLPNISGFVSAYLRYQLSAPYLGGNYPLSVDGSQVVSGTVAAARLPLATASVQGIVAPMRATYTYPTIGQAGGLTGTNLLSYQAAKAIYYQDQAGAHRLRFNISLTYSSAATSQTVSLTGVTFAAFYQAVAAFGYAAPNSIATSAQADASASSISIIGASAVGIVHLSGDVELTSKPTWA